MTGRRFVWLALAVSMAAASCAGSDEDERAPAPGPAPVGDGGGAEPGAVGDAGAGDSAPPAPSVPQVQLIGRFDQRSPEHPLCAWPGCRIVARFLGDSVSVTLTETEEDWMVGTPSEWDVSIDGVREPKLVVEPGEQSFTLAEDLGPGPHLVELYKRSEAQVGTTSFDGFSFGDGGSLLPPPPRRDRAIEMIGDSMAAGFGVEGVGPDCPVSNQAARWENFRLSFGALLGEQLDADVYGTVYSGKGITQNIWRPDPWTMPRIFPLADPLDPMSGFDVSSMAPDVVILALGGLDFAVGQPVDNGPATIDDFAAGYAAFTRDLREAYPSAQILCVVGPPVEDEEQNRMIRDKVFAGITKAVAARKAAGDARVSMFALSLAHASELTGCEGHGNPGFHQRVARELLPVVKSLTGW